MKILYVPGPLNAVRTYNYWTRGQEDSSSVAIPYLQQFFELCKHKNIEAIICSSIELDEDQLSASIINNKVEFEYVPALLQKSAGLLFHIGQILYLLQIGMIALTRRVDVIVMTASRQHLFALFPFTLLGIAVVPTLHCTFWPKYQPPTGLMKRFILRLTGWFLRSMHTPILAFPGEVSRQVFELTDLSEKLVLNFLPTYKPTLFATIAPPDLQSSRFHILYLGRLTRDKGVYTILEIARQFHEKGMGNLFAFDICGDGPELQPLRLRVEELQLEDLVFCHGFCDRDKVAEMLNHSHIIIVPTTTSFIEGFNKVVVEGVLANRPVVTSAVCPSLVTVQDAVVEVDADNDVDSYVRAIAELQSDHELYLQKQKSCLQLQSQFYDQDASWGTQLSQALSYLEEQKVTKKEE